MDPSDHERFGPSVTERRKRTTAVEKLRCPRANHHSRDEGAYKSSLCAVRTRRLGTQEFVLHPPSTIRSRYCHASLPRMQPCIKNTSMKVHALEIRNSMDIHEENESTRHHSDWTKIMKIELAIMKMRSNVRTHLQER